MTASLVRLWLVPAVAALSLAGCGGSPADAPHPDAAPAAATPAAENLAREKPDAGKVEHVTITASGQGKSLGGAVNQAILLAVQQVNGTTVDAVSVQLESGVELQIADQSLDIHSSAFADLVATQTHGNVSSFRILSQKQDSEHGSYDVAIEARIAKFARPESANRLSVAIVAFRTEGEAYVVDTTQVSSAAIAQQIRENVTSSLAKTNRFTVIDRDFTAETDAELDLISSGKMSKDDLARVGQRVAADYLLIGRIDRFGYERHEQKLRASGRTLVSHSGGASLTLRMVNVTTGQIEQADTVSITLPETEPTTLGTSVDADRIVANLSSGLSEQAAQKIVSHLFPVTILSVDGDDVVLSQGGEALKEGGRYQVVVRGKEMKDPQTGQSLGRLEKPCCIVLVTKVSPQLSYGTLANKQIDVSSSFAPGALEVRGVLAAEAKPVAANQPSAETASAAPAAASVEKPDDKPKKSTSDSDW
jgi:curli biogenesis system outer membrane secretion channel CsgG